MVIVPVSSGSRRASSALRENSGNSSRNKTPSCASEISPGLGGEPPPTSATALQVWCGWLVRRCIHWSGVKRPARLAMAALSSAWVSVIAGSLERFYAEVHAIVGELLYARNFYIALLSADGTRLEIPYSVDMAGDERGSRLLEREARR